MQCLLQYTLRALSRNSHVTQGTGSTRGFATSTLRAGAALDSFGRTGQPYVATVKPLLAYALRCSTSLNDLLPTAVTPVLDALLRRAVSEVTADNARCQATARSLAQALDQTFDITAARDVVRSLLLRAADAGLASSDLLELAREVACFVGVYGRDSDSLADDLRRLPEATNEQLLDALLPVPRRLHVASPVLGARQLHRVESLLPGAEMLSPRTSSDAAEREWPAVPDSFAGHGADKRLEAFLDRLPRRGAMCVIVTTVDAADLATASQQGRRAIAEVLDQYLAGERLADLGVGPTVFAHDPSTGQCREDNEGRPGVRLAYPLTYQADSALAPALHAAHLARRVAAPLTKAGFAWVTLESAGLIGSGQPRLVKTLALQAVRQQLLTCFEGLRDGFLSRERLHEDRVRRCALEQARVEAGMLRCPPERAARREQLEAQSAALEQVQAMLEAEKGTAEAARTSFDQLLMWLGVDEHLRLLDVDRWAALLSAEGDDLPETTQARAALEVVVGHVPRLASAQVELWWNLTRVPTRLAGLLAETEVDFEVLLKTLKGARNQALHRAENRARGDVLLGGAAEAVVDLTLECLSLWFRQVDADGLLPSQVTAAISNRYDAIVRHCVEGGATASIDFSRLTSPAATSRTGVRSES